MFFDKKEGIDMNGIRGEVTVASALGGRSYQEDYFCKMEFMANGCFGQLIAVFDGHGGFSAAQAARNLTYEKFKINCLDDTEDALRRIIALLDEETKDMEMGSTVSMACILESHRRVYVAVLGDSPVLVKSSNGSIHVGPEHNVYSNEIEREAAIARGAHYEERFKCGYVYYGMQGLQMSRSIGDADLRPILSQEPDIYSLPIDEHSYVMVASDGITSYGYYDNNNIGLVAGLLNAGHDAASLRDHIVAKEPRDNVTILVWRAFKG